MNRIIIKILSLAVLFFALVSGLKAQSNTFYFMKGVPQTKDMNPARIGLESGFYVSMPFITKQDLSLNTNNWTYKDLVHPGTGTEKNRLIWDFKSLISSLDKKNFAQESASITLLDFGWKKKDQTFSFSLTEKESAELTFTKKLAELIYYGNEPYIGTNFHTGKLGINALHYRQFAFTWSKAVDKKLTVGISGKLLFGMTGLRTKNISMSTETLPSGDQLNLETQGTLFISAPVEFNHINNGYKYTTTNTFDPATYFLQMGNPGLAVDLGFSSKISKKLELSMSIIDLGMISWRNNLSVFRGGGSFSFEGINLNDSTLTPSGANSLKPVVHALRDELMTAFPLDKTSSNFASMLPVKIFAGAEYHLNKMFNVNGLARLRFFGNTFHASFTASVNAVLHKNISLYTSYSIYESSYNNIGIGTAMKIGPFQVYLVTDNIASAFHPESASNLNLTTGINFVFLTPEWIEKKRTFWMPDVRHKRLE